MSNTPLPFDTVHARNVSNSVTLPNAEFPRYGSSKVVVPTTRDPVIPRPPIAPQAPVIAGRFLTAPQLSFYEFLFEPHCINYCRFLLGEEASSLATFVAELPLGAEFNYFGPRKGRGGRNAGKLDDSNSATKESLEHFVRRAYQGDREQRGVDYWVDIMGLLWNAYCDLMARRMEVEAIQTRVTKRKEGLARKRALTAARVRRHRDKQNPQWSFLQSGE